MNNIYGGFGGFTSNESSAKAAKAPLLTERQFLNLTHLFQGFYDVIATNLADDPAIPDNDSGSPPKPITYPLLPTFNLIRINDFMERVRSRAVSSSKYISFVKSSNDIFVFLALLALKSSTLESHLTFEYLDNLFRDRTKSFFSNQIEPIEKMVICSNIINELLTHENFSSKLSKILRVVGSTSSPSERSNPLTQLKSICNDRNKYTMNAMRMLYSETPYYQRRLIEQDWLKSSPKYLKLSQIYRFIDDYSSSQHTLRNFHMTTFFNMYFFIHSILIPLQQSKGKMILEKIFGENYSKSVHKSTNIAGGGDEREYEDEEEVEGENNNDRNSDGSSNYEQVKDKIDEINKDCKFAPSKEDYAYYNGLIQCKLMIPLAKYAQVYKKIENKLAKLDPTIMGKLTNSYGENILQVFKNLIFFMNMNLFEVEESFEKFNEIKQDSYIYKSITYQWLYNLDINMFSKFLSCNENEVNDANISAKIEEFNQNESGRLQTMYNIQNSMKDMIATRRQKIIEDVAGLIQDEQYNDAIARSIIQTGTSPSNLFDNRERVNQFIQNHTNKNARMVSQIVNRYEKYSDTTSNIIRNSSAIEKDNVVINTALHNNMNPFYSEDITKLSVYKQKLEKYTKISGEFKTWCENVTYE